MASATRHRIRYRCGVSKCRVRFAQKKRAKRDPKCPDCGDTIRVRDIEQERRREYENQITCRCDAYPFPHRAGSLTMCKQNSNRAAGINPTTEEIWSYKKCLATPRSGTI